MCKEFYEKKLDELEAEIKRIKAQIELLEQNLNTNSPNDKRWMNWWTEKNDFKNKLCNLIGSRVNTENKIASFD